MGCPPRVKFANKRDSRSLQSSRFRPTIPPNPGLKPSKLVVTNTSPSQSTSTNCTHFSNDSYRRRLSDQVRPVVSESLEAVDNVAEKSSLQKCPSRPISENLR